MRIELRERERERETDGWMNEWNPGYIWNPGTWADIQSLHRDNDLKLALKVSEADFFPLARSALHYSSVCTPFT